MKIALNSTTNIDLDKLIESRALIQANSGGGKSHTIRRIIEQAFGKVQIIVIDPEGEFGNMRSKYGFVYAGKDGDTPADPRSAALLARRLLELEASAIIDLYELSPQERKHFVRLFCEALVNAPKNLWHDVLVIIDEAHVFAPEKNDSEALGAVIDLASRGRKRGYCAILATQRAAKLNKDAAAECNNKLIGRASLDIDRKRSADELGFSERAAVLSLRDLEPGEFYAFGPAISRTVEKITIGDILVKPEKRGSKRAIAAPSAQVKKILAQLADLPKEAEEEAKTIAALTHDLTVAKREIAELKRQKPAVDPKAIEAAVQRERAAFSTFKDVLYKKLLKSHGNITKELDELYEVVTDMRKGETIERIPYTNDHKQIHVVIDEASNVSDRQWGLLESRSSRPTSDKVPLKLIEHPDMRHTITVGTMGNGERKVLIAIAGDLDGISREYVTLLTGYKRSTRDAYIQRLFQKGYVGIRGDIIKATPNGITALGSAYKPLPTGPDLAAHYLNTLPEGERKVFQVLYDAGMALDREQISDRTGYKRSTRDAYIQRLRLRQLVSLRGEGMVKAHDSLY